MSESDDNKRLGDFELLREIGRGGMGVVYEARQISLKRRVALKVLPPGLGLTDQAVRRFEREAQAAARLHHTNIVPVYATGQDHGCHYYAMELVEGQSLSRILDDLRGERSNPLMEATVTRHTTDTAGTTAAAETTPAPEPSPAAESTTSFSDTDTGGRKWFDTAAKLMSDVADALHFAHDQGVIHRDVKPANLLLSGDGRLCLGDFGLARVVQEPGMTVSGSFLGTPAYMSPEQIAAGRVKLDHRTDVYSLGAVLYEMLTLRRPFSGDSREQILTGILSKEPRPPRRINPRVPLDLETICLKAMEKDPDRRYATAAAMAADLKQYLGRGLITARRAGPLRRFGKLLRRHPVAATVAIGLVLLAVAVGGTARVLTSQKAGEAAGRALAEARVELNKGDYREALDRVDQALGIAPGMTEARLLRARLLMNLNRTREAVDEAQSLLDRDPDDWSAHLILAAAAKRAGFDPVLTIPAEEHVRAVADLAPETAEAYYLRSLVVDSSGEAVELLNRALELDPGNVEALVERIHRLIRLKNFEAALVDCERLLAIRPRSAQGRSLMGVIYTEQYDPARALEQLERAIEIDPGEPRHVLRRADVYLKTGRTDEAIADLTRAIELDPGRASLYAERSDAYLIQQDDELAIADARRAIELDADSPAGYRALLSAHEDRADDDAAEEVLSSFREASKGWADRQARAEAHYFMGLHYFATGRNAEQAVAEADRALELAPDFWDVSRFHQLRIMALKRLEGRSAVAEDCARIAGLAVDEPQALLWRAMDLQVQCRRTDLAFGDLSRAIELAPWWADPYLLRGWLLRDEGRLDESLADIDKAIELAPRWGRAYLDRCATYRKLERFEEALADCETALEGGLWANNKDRALNRRVEILLRLDREDEAFASLDSRIEEKPESHAAYGARGFRLFQQGRIDEALRDADKAIALHPGGGAVEDYLDRATAACYKPGACDQVRSDLEKVLELAPQDPLFVAGVAETHGDEVIWACPDLYDAELALELATRAVEIDPENGWYRRVLGVVLFRHGRYEEARAALLQSLELLADEEPTVLFYLAMASFKSGRAAEAPGFYDRAVAEVERTYPRQPNFVRQREEAAKLLGVE